MNTIHALSGTTFADRLVAALTALGYPTTATALAKKFNEFAGEDSMTVHGTRKWLVGESIPHQSRLLLLANWLNVHPQWLRYGDGAVEMTAMKSPEGLSRQDMRLIANFHRLVPEAQVAVEGIIETLLKHPSMRS
jgi:hypothetical protein